MEHESTLVAILTTIPPSERIFVNRVCYATATFVLTIISCAQLISSRITGYCSHA